MDSESTFGAHVFEDQMAHADSYQNLESTTSSNESVDYAPLKEDAPPSLLPTWLMIMGILLVSFWIWRATNRYLEKYRRRQAVLERRRRAGIPDEDTRPFDIANAEAALRRRERDDERRRKELEEAESSRRDSDWSRLGRTISHGQDSRYEARPYSANLVQRRPVIESLGIPQPIPLPNFDYNRNHQTTLPLRGMQPIESPTISSSDSPPHPAPPIWQDQYAPPEIKAQHDRQRERALAATATASTLGRRSRKHLVLDGDSNSEADIPSRVRRRTNQWGASEAIDGDDNSRWVTSSSFGQEQVQRRTRKRDADGDSDIENEDPRVKSKRKVDAETPTIPGQFKSPTAVDHTQSSAISGPGKRKAREDEEGTEIDDSKGQRSIKQKKRVRVLSYHESKQGDAEPADEDMAEGEETQDSQESVRRPGEEWTVDGKKHKVDEDGVTRILGYVKESSSTLHTGRFSPKRSIKTTISAKWLTEEEYADAEKAGSLVPGAQEEYISIEQHPLSRAGSEAPSDWSAAVGQTPLKTGGMKTGLGSDRHPPPFASLPHAGNLPVEQHRLLHLASPARKGLMLGSRSLRPMGSQSQWERKQAEAKAMEALREARRKVKAEATPAVKPAATVAAIGEVPKTTQATVAPTSTSLPTFTLTTPAAAATTSEPKTVTFNLPGTTTATPAPEKKDEKKAEPPKLAFSFAPAATTPSTTTTTAPTVSTPAPPALFAAPAATSTASSATTPATTAPSLFGNLGQPKAEEKKPEAPATSGSTFELSGATSASIGKPGFSFGRGSSLFGSTAPAASSTTVTTTSAPTTSTGAKPAEPPKLGFSFGNPAPSTTAPLFGAQSAQSTSAAPSTTAPPTLFGSTTATDDANKRPSATPVQPSTTGTGLFGASSTTTQPTGALFGGASGFGGSTTSGFGSAAPRPDSAPKTGFGFGSTATAPTTNGFSFAGAAAKPAENAPAADNKPVTNGGLSIFGAAKNPPSSTTGSGFAPPSLFGGQATSSTPAFGQTASNGTSNTTSAFGQPSTSTPTTNGFGQTSAFGQTSSSTTTSAFGQPANAPAPAFGPVSSGPAPLSFGSLSAHTPTATAFGASTPAATTTAFGQSSAGGATTPSVSTFGGANGTTSAFGGGPTSATSAKPNGGFSFNFGNGGSGANSAPGTPVPPTSAVAPTFNFGAGKPSDGTTSPRTAPLTPGGRTFKALPRARR